MIFYLLACWNIFADFYCSVYFVAVIICTLFYLFKKDKWKNEAVNWIYVFNTIVLWTTLINFIFYAAELFIAWYGQNPYEWYAFTENRAGLWGPYGWGYWVLLFFNFILPQLFWFKKLRRNVLFTFIAALFLSLGIWFERLVILITSSYRDYLPSSWSTYDEGRSAYYFQILIKLVCFIIVSVFTYWLLNKRKKLPFPSAILSYFLFFISYSLFHCIHHFN